MAIEFNCPYCTAAIRVPDEFSGKRGSCPKCETKLLVPDVVPGAFANPETAAPTPPPRPNDDAAVAVGLSDDSVPPIVPVQSPASIFSSLEKKRRRGKSQQLAGMLIPAVCFFAFVGVVGLVFVLQTPELKGTLRGNAAANMVVPTVNVPIADLGLTESEREGVRLAFRTTPDSYLSDQMTCRVELTGTSLAIDVEAGDGFSWYTVNPTTDVVLASWIRKNANALDKARLQQATQAGEDLCRDKVIRANGTPVEIAAEHYRDDFGLNFRARAFGYAVEAVAGKRRSLCAHEDDNGTLYFILPTGISKFTLRGRKLASNALKFTGEYRVIVAGTNAAAATVTEPAEDKPAADAMEVQSGEEPMSDPEQETPDQPTGKMMSPM